MQFQARTKNRIVKLVDYETFVAKPNAALPIKRRQLTASAASPTRTRRSGSPCRSTDSSENQMLTIASPHKVFLTSRLHRFQNADSQKYERARDDPVPGNVHEVSGIDQADDDDRESTRVKTEGHSVSWSHISSPGLAASVQKETHRDIGSWRRLNALVSAASVIPS